MPKISLFGGIRTVNPFKGKTPQESQALNWQLSRNRAQSVATVLMQQDIFKNRIKTYGYGDSRPVVKGNSSMG
jgi:flagellar motor protein MotB